MADPHLFEESVAGILAATNSTDLAAAAPRFDDPVTDAFSVAATANRDRVRAPDPAVERDLPPVDAVAAASGLMIARTRLRHRWWHSVTAPMVVRAQQGPVAVVPDSTGRALEYNADTRTSHRVHAGSGIEPDAVSVIARLPMDTRWTHLILWSMRNQRRSVLELIALTLLTGLTALLVPLATSALFSYAIPWGDLRTALAVLVVFGVASVAAAVLLLARNSTLIGLRDTSDARLSAGLLASVLRLPTGFFRSRPPGELLNRGLCVEQARMLVDDSVLMLVLTAVFGLTNLLFLASLSAMIGALVSATIVALVAGSVVIQLRARSALADVLATRSELDDRMMECLAAAVPIRVAAAEPRAFDLWAKTNAVWLRAAAVRMARLNAVQPLSAVAPILINLVLVLGVVSSAAPVSPRAFVPAYAAIVQLTVSMTLLSQNLTRLWELGPILQQMHDITGAEPERAQQCRAPGQLQGAISLNNIVFGYSRDEPPLFNGLSMTVQPGEFVAIVGPSGSGKTTLLRLLLGFEQPWSGVVEFDGNDLAQLDVAAVRRQMGTVTQASVPFGSTLRECVCGPRDFSDVQLMSALTRAGLDDVASRAGLDADVGERGVGLSGGQQQRLMIARALIGDPRILLLDEATSALDNVTQEIVMAAVTEMSATRIAIAHRLSTIVKADRVLVVDQGRIVEEGPPDVLRGSGGHFARLAARQEF